MQTTRFIRFLAPCPATRGLQSSEAGEVALKKGACGEENGYFG